MRSRAFTKYIIFDHGDVMFAVDFRYSWFKGVYDIELHAISNGEHLDKQPTLDRCYPNILERLHWRWNCLKDRLLSRQESR